MLVRTVVRDCLYLNWALPADDLPALPEPLRYERHGANGGDMVFASALLFRQSGLHLSRMPLLRLSYPQFNLRLYVIDGDGIPAVFFQSMLVPGWVVPSARVVAEHPARSAHFRYPRPSRTPGADGWSWSVRRRAELRVAARQSSPSLGPGPACGSWERLTRLLSRRRRGYYRTSSGLKCVDASMQPGSFWPLTVEVEEGSLLQEALPLAAGGWPRPHSAWLCPEISFAFEIAAVERPVTSPASPVAADPAMFGRSGRAAA